MLINESDATFNNERRVLKKNIVKSVKEMRKNK